MPRSGRIRFSGVRAASNLSDHRREQGTFPFLVGCTHTHNIRHHRLRAEASKHFPSQLTPHLLLTLYWSRLPILFYFSCISFLLRETCLPLVTPHFQLSQPRRMLTETYKTLSGMTTTKRTSLSLLILLTRVINQVPTPRRTEIGHNPSKFRELMISKGTTIIRCLPPALRHDPPPPPSQTITGIQTVSSPPPPQSRHLHPVRAAVDSAYSSARPSVQSFLPITRHSPPNLQALGWSAGDRRTMVSSPMSWQSLFSLQERSSKTMAYSSPQKRSNPRHLLYVYTCECSYFNHTLG